MESGENPLGQDLCQNLYQSFLGHTQLERDLFQLVDTRVLGTRPSLVVLGGVLCLLVHPVFSRGLQFSAGRGDRCLAARWARALLGGRVAGRRALDVAWVVVYDH